MSMLAERKRKIKWSINPRGNAWTNDNSKFGQKMLEKMGWQQGKGLGAKEDGIKEQIKVSYKNDSKGMGFKDNGEQWTEHESKFSELLEALGGKTNPDEIKLNSLEKKSQTSRARVHYHKFTRGKDLSRYSEKDLANIFGKRNLNEINKQDDTEIKQEEEKKEDSKKNGFLFNGGSMHDYFKKKLSNFTNFSNDVTPKDSESEEDARPAFGFGFKSEKFKKDDSLKIDSNKSSFVSYIEEGTVKRKAENHLENDILSPKKKIKKEKSEDSENLGLSNPAFNPMATPIKVKKHKLSPIEEISEINEVKIKNDQPVEKNGKRKVKDKRIEINTETIENNSIQEEEIDENQVKKKRKKKKLEDTNMGISNPFFESTVESNKEIITEDNKFEVKRTKKNKKKNKDKENKPVENEFENGAYNDETDGADFIGEHIENEDETNPYEVKIKKKKKRKPVQNDDNNLGLTNPIFEDNIGEKTPEPLDTLEQNVSKKKKKRKKEKESDNFSLENPCFNDVPVDETVISVEENPYEVKRAKKKKNKKQDVNDVIKDNSIDISINSNNDSIDDSCDLMLNIVSEPQVPKPNKQTEKVGSIKKVQTKRRKSVRFSDITQEVIIPNNDELREMENSFQNGIDNENFDSIQMHVSENLETISKQLDTFQAEIENDINEKKMTTFEEIVVGEIGNPDGENEKLPDSTRLKFKYATMDTKTPMYQLNKTGAKKSYKHLIKGDIVVKFKNTNLHEIKGYATSKKKFGRNK